MIEINSQFKLLIVPNLINFIIFQTRNFRLNWEILEYLNNWIILKSLGQHKRELPFI